MPIALYDKLVSAFGGSYADANRVDTTQSRTVQEQLDINISTIQSLLNQSTVSGRGFRVLNTTTLAIDNTNVADFVNINTIYGAGVDKISTWTLPTDTDISAAGIPYPVLMEFTHLGGTQRVVDGSNNRLSLNIAAGDAARISQSGLINLQGINMLRGDIAVLSKAAAGQNWVSVRSLHSPNTMILPNGTWEFHGSNPIVQNIANLVTELNGVLINSGDVFIVETGGDYFGQTILDNALIVSMAINPGLTTNDGDDWYVINNGEGVLTSDQIAFFNNVVRDGTRFDLSQFIFANPSNVNIATNSASNLPGTFNYNTDSEVSPATARTAVFNNQNFQFTNLVGGKLSLSISFNTSSIAGFPPELVSISFVYGAFTFTFPLTNIDPQSGSAVVDITIANVDYTSILNTNCNITLNYNFRGQSFIGSFTVSGLVNTEVGSLHDAIVALIAIEAGNIENRLQTELNAIRGTQERDEATFDSILPRISPYRNIRIETPDTDVRFLDSTGSDNFPTTIASMMRVNSANPRFTLGNVAVFIAVVSGSSYVLRNITQDTEIDLLDSTANVSLGESLTDNGITYFVFRVTSLTVGDVLEVENVTIQQVVAWQNSINSLLSAVARIDAELAHALLNLPDALVQFIENDIAVTEESTPSTVATAYNIGLSPGTSQAVFYEGNPVAPTGGFQTSEAINANSGNDRYRNKLIYVPPATYSDGDFIHAFFNMVSTILVSYENDTFFAHVFVPAVPAGNTTVTLYPAQATHVSGAGIWQTIEALTFVNGVPVTEADEIFFTRNIPTTSTTLTIQYRGHANGNLFGANSVTLAGVGGASEVATTFNLSVGNEVATVEVRYFPNFQGGGREIRVSVTERVQTGLPTINDVQVILSYTETRTVPATAATTRTVELESLSTTEQVFAVKADSSGNLIIVGNETEVNTNYLYTTLFGNDESGHLSVANEDATFLDYEDFDIIDTTIVDLQNHATLPQFGLFTTNYTHDTIVTLDTQLRAHNSQGDVVNLAQELILVAPNNSRWRLSVDNAGTLTTTQVT